MVDIDGECKSSFNDKQRWMEGLNQNENYWEGVVSDVDQVLWRHGLETVTSYGTRTSRKVIQKDKMNELANKENLVVSSYAWCL